MSISLNIGSFKNPSDRSRKQQQYHEYLRLQSSLNARSEKANKEQSRNRSMGIKPGPPPYRSVEEELQDEVAQREQAMKNLREIMPREALAGLQYLPDINELNLFNRYFPDFKQKVAGQKFITPDVFGDLWRRYKELLTATNNTGIQIPLTQTGLQESLRREAQVVLDTLDANLRISRRDHREIAEFLNRAVQDGNADVIARVREAATDNEANLDHVMTVINQSIERKAQQLIDLLFDTRRQSMLGRASIRRDIIQAIHTATAEGNVEVINRLDRAIRDGNEDAVRAIVDNLEPIMTEGVNEMQLRSWTVQELKARAKVVAGVRADTALARAMGLNRGADIRKDDLIIYLLENPMFYDAREPRRTIQPVAESPPREQGEADFVDELWGTGIAEQSSAYYATTKGLLRPVRGRGLGITAPTPERYLPFGKLWIHLPSLKVGKLNLKYPSYARIAEFPSTPISKELKKFITDLVENRKMNLKGYQALKESDRKLFNKAAKRAGLDDHLGIEEDEEELEERERMLERFEILRGEISAGNDAIQIKQELKRILARFINDGTVSKSQGTQLLIELSV